MMLLVGQYSALSNWNTVPPSHFQEIPAVRAGAIDQERQLVIVAAKQHHQTPGLTKIFPRPAGVLLGTVQIRVAHLVGRHAEALGKAMILADRRNGLAVENSHRHPNRATNFETHRRLENARRTAVAAITYPMGGRPITKLSGRMDASNRI